MTTSTSIRFEGPFFAHDPKLTFRQNVRVWADGLAREGEAEVRRQMMVGQGHRQPVRATGGRASALARGRTSSLAGRRWAVSAAVGISRSHLSSRQAVSVMAAAKQVERQTGAFRRVTSAIRRSRAANTDELLKGIA